MSELPKISGWPDRNPILDPKSKALFVLQDLKELQRDHHLLESPSWLSLVGKNAYELETIMAQLKENPSFSDLAGIYNWFQNAEEKGHSLSEILFDLKESHFKQTAPLKTFFRNLLEDKAGLTQIIHMFEKYLTKK